MVDPNDFIAYWLTGAIALVVAIVLGGIVYFLAKYPEGTAVVLAVYATITLGPYAVGRVYWRVKEGVLG